jgi:vacuolar protein sorting-associated protein 13A/C
VCLTFYPEGAEWDEPEPVIISEGFLGSTAGVEATARQLPSSFSVGYTNSQASRGLKLRISLQKHIDTELLTSQRLRAAAAKAAAAGASSSAAAAAVLRDSHPEAWRMSYGTALAQGRPLTLSLSAPVWLVNGTQLPIAVGIVPITTAAAGGTGDTGAPATGDPASGSSSQDPSVSNSQGVGHLRVMDTEAFTTVIRPSDQVVIMGNSIELMSYPPDPLAQDSSSMRSPFIAELGAAGGVVTQWAAVFSIMGSRWSTPIVLSTAGAAPPGVSGDTPVADAMSRLPRYDPVLIRARCRDGSVYEVTVRLESAGTGLPLAMLVRLDPHVVVSNRTGYTLHMLQPEPIWKALGSTQSNSTWLLSSGSGRVSNQGAWIASAPSGAPGTYGSTGSSRANTSTSTSTSSNRPQQPRSASAAHEATLVLRPGALAVPLSWPAGASRRLLALTLPPRVGGSSGNGGAAAAAAAAAAELSQQLDPSMWSEPFKVSYPATGVMQVLLPLYQLGTAGEPRPVDAASMAAALGAFRKLVQPQPQQQQQQQQGKDGGGGQAGLPPKPPSSSRGAASIQQQQEAAGHDNTPMLVHVAKQSEAGLLEYLAVTVNVSVEMPTPGCLHLVLQSLGGEPQQCLMNCTPSAISFRQATPRSAWQLLPSYSATALVLLQPPDVLSGLAGGSTDPLQLPSCSEVMLRDSDPATSGMAVCTFDTDSSGMPTAQAAKQRSGSSSGGSQRGGVVTSSSEAPAVFPLHGGDKQALAQVRPHKQQVH